MKGYWPVPLPISSGTKAPASSKQLGRVFPSRIGESVVLTRASLWAMSLLSRRAYELCVEATAAFETGLLRD